MVTVAAVAKSCQLPCHLTEEAAFRATNKVAMTQAYKKFGVPIGQRIFVKENFEDNSLEELHYPLVIKPVDAQGQIGTSLIQDHTLLRKSIELALKHSRSKTVAVEEFIEGPEIAAGAWLEKGKLNLIAVTDRVTYNPPPAIGISLQHILPSKTAADAYQNIADILSRVARAYEITDGPLHAQLIMSQDGPRVMEVGCRFGGANEVDLYKHTLGIDILEKTLDLAFGDFHPLNFDFRRDGFQCHGLINLVVAREGVLARHEPLDRYLETGKIVDGGWYKKDGFVQRKITDAYGRIGWFLVTGRHRESVLEQAAEVYSQLQVSSLSGENLIFWPDNQYLNLCDR
ncbi:MAG: Alanine-anticapsin ligase BacD [Syntrophus sp. PtaB.Bin001]|nr:MAG: Alanine-anticapsin ligase BacD [Syntrophus sp. PtaB.Bin001]